MNLVYHPADSDSYVLNGFTFEAPPTFTDRDVIKKIQERLDSQAQDSVKSPYIWMYMPRLDDKKDFHVIPKPMPDGKFTIVIYQKD